MTPFTFDQFVILILVFILGLLVGMFLVSNKKWKARYREEMHRREELERENEQLRRDGREMDTLRHAAARDTRPGPL